MNVIATELNIGQRSEYGKRSAAKVTRSIWREGKTVRPYLSLLFVSFATFRPIGVNLTRDLETRAGKKNTVE